MDLRNLLSDSDKDLMWKYINERLYSGDSTHQPAEINHLLRFWDRDKKDLCHLLGNQVIIEKPISYEMTPEEKGIRLENAIDNCYSDPALGDINRLINDIESLYFTEYFQDYNGNGDINDRDARLYISHLFDRNSLGQNKVMYWGDKPINITFTHGPHAEGNKPLVLKSDMKIMRAVAKIVDWFELDKNACEHMRIYFSQVLNDCTIKCNARLSIHPLDYLTMSDNDCGWDSCMNWADPGQYRLGTIEMMNSPVVVEAYIESKHPYRPVYKDDRTWSNKRWRCLYIVNKDIITEVKQYPYKNKVLTDFFMNWLKELAETNMGWHYGEMLEVDKKGENKLPDGRTLKVYMNTNAMYNDYYDKHWAFINPEVNTVSINYSGETECMVCGEALDTYDFVETEDVVCARCQGKIKCADCDQWFDINNDFYDFNENTGLYYCDWCYDAHHQTCDCCAETKWEEEFDMGDIFRVIIPNPDVMVCNYKRLCNNCFTDYGFDKLPRHNDAYYLDDLSQEQREVLDIKEYNIKIAQDRQKEIINFYYNKERRRA